MSRAFYFTPPFDNQVNKHDLNTLRNITTKDAMNRIDLFEDILKIQDSKTETIGTRLKNIEDKLLLIEEKFPQIASEYFSYFQEVKNTGRVSQANLFQDHAPVMFNVDVAELFESTCKMYEDLLKKVKLENN